MHSYGYDPATLTLEVEFLAKKEEDKRKVYRYCPVPAAKFAEFEAADSLGSHFLKFIKPNYSCTKVEEKNEAQSEKEPTPPAAA